MSETHEEWLAIPGYEGSYEVSNRGRVRSLDRTIHDKTGRDRFWPGKLLKPQPLKSFGGGRLVVMLRDHSRGDTRLVARLVLEAFVGPCPTGMEACHNNGICTDDRLENLRWDTRQANMLDQVRHGGHYEASLTHCKYGHALNGTNVRAHRLKKGRICRSCACARAEAQRAVMRGEPKPDHQTLSDVYYRRFTGGVIAC